MTIRFIYTGHTTYSRCAVSVRAGGTVQSLSYTETIVTLPDNTDSFILQEAWIKTKPYRLSPARENHRHGNEETVILWNTSGSLLFAVLQMLLFQSSSQYFYVVMNNPKKTAEWRKRENNAAHLRFCWRYPLPVRLLIECGIFAGCMWCGTFLGKLIFSALHTVL